MGHELTHWTIRVSLAAYLASATLRLWRPRATQAMAVARWAWMLAALGSLAHLVCAMHFYHGWSHSEAYEHTARRTQELVGWDWGGGLYFNHGFALLWLGDAAWWWLAPRSYLARPPALNLALQAFLVFMIFNATVVFGRGPIRWCGAAGVLALAVATLPRLLHGRRARGAPART
jgi:hypothetical protein